MNKLANKVAVITGGTTGIGFATAKLFADEGATVIVTGKNPKTLEIARAELRGRAEVIAADATSVAELDRLYAQIKERHGRIDVLFANVGGGALRPMAEVDEAYFDEVVALNLKSAYFTVQRAAPLLARGASVIFNSSVVAERAFPAMSVYSASKAAVRQLARSLGAELLPQGVRVNVVSPGPVETPIIDKIGFSGGKDAFLDAVSKLVPMRRVGNADELARAVLFLASDDASFVTGVSLGVDGGFGSF